MANKSQVLQHSVDGSKANRLPVMVPGQWDERLSRGSSFSAEIAESAESFRLLRSRILHPHDDRPAPRTIMVTSALPQEGKSFVSANLGITLAQGVDQHSLLVDCDLRIPTLAGLFGVARDAGLVDYLQGSSGLVDLIQKTSVAKLSILPSGTPPANPAELLGSDRMRDLVEELSKRYEDRFIIFDSPPSQVASESIVLSQVVDGVVLVVRHGASGAGVVKKVIAEIGPDKIIGVVFNAYKRNILSSALLYKNDYSYGGYYHKQQ